MVYDVIPDPPSPKGPRSWLTGFLLILGLLGVAASLVLVGYLL